MKGYGYRLTLHEAAFLTPNPIVENKDFLEQANKLFNMYYMYGQGKAVEAFATTQSLSFPLEEEQELNLLALKGDFKTIVEGDRFTPESKLPLLLFLYAYIEEDLRKVIDSFRRILEKGSLSKEREDEFHYLILPWQYVYNGDIDLAKKIVGEAKQTFLASDEGFYPSLSLLEAMIFLKERKMEKGKETLEALETYLKQHPFQREMGLLSVLKGMYYLGNSHEKQGKQSIDKGIEIIEESQHKYYFLVLFSVIDYLLPHFDGSNHKLRDYYKKIKNKFDLECNFAALENSIRKQVASFL